MGIFRIFNVFNMARISVIQSECAESIGGASGTKWQLNEPLLPQCILCKEEE